MSKFQRKMTGTKETRENSLLKYERVRENAFEVSHYVARFINSCTNKGNASVIGVWHFTNLRELSPLEQETRSAYRRSGWCAESNDIALCVDPQHVGMLRPRAINCQQCSSAQHKPMLFVLKQSLSLNGRVTS